MLFLADHHAAGPPWPAPADAAFRWPGAPADRHPAPLEPRGGRGDLVLQAPRNRLETITEARLPAYNQAVNAELRRTGLPPAAYMDGDTAIYERIARYEARFNRLLVYRGHTLHSANLPSGRPLPADPRTGRFSVNAFIWLDG